jgi:hypothetical protein
MKKEQRQFQSGREIAKIPSVSGLYAWYYKPVFPDSSILIQTLKSFLDTPGQLSTQIDMRYGVNLVAKSSLKMLYGSQNQSIEEITNEALQKSESFILHFFKSEAVQFFTRPIYIGIAKNLYRRVYTQHFSQLVEKWDDNSRISKYLTLRPDVTVQTVMDELNLPHSFALEARVRKIPPRDLMVQIFTTDELPNDIGSDDEDSQSDTQHRRTLEKLLQIMADPICGRR